MPADLSLRDILSQRLRADGYDGLVHDSEECGCGLDDLMPCDSPSPRCMAAYRVPVPEGADSSEWYSTDRPTEAPDAD